MDMFAASMFAPHGPATHDLAQAAAQRVHVLESLAGLLRARTRAGHTRQGWPLLSGDASAACPPQSASTSLIEEGETGRSFRGASRRSRRLTSARAVGPFAALRLWWICTCDKLLCLRWGELVRARPGRLAQAKESLLEHTSLRGLGATTAAAMVAGFFASACSLPFDFVKTRMQRMRADPVTGKMPYAGFGDCFMKARPG